MISSGILTGVLWTSAVRETVVTQQKGKRSSMNHTQIPNQIRPLTLALAFSLALVFSAHGQVQVAKSFALPVRVTAAVDVSQCNNSPGPQITISGAMS